MSDRGLKQMVIAVLVVILGSITVDAGLLTVQHNQTSWKRYEVKAGDSIWSIIDRQNTRRIRTIFVDQDKESARDEIIFYNRQHKIGVSDDPEVKLQPGNEIYIPVWGVGRLPK